MIGNDDEKEIEDEGEAESDWDSLRCKSGESASIFQELCKPDLSLKVTFPRERKEPAKVLHGKIKSPPPGPVERDDVRTIGSPHTSPSRKENVKRIRVDVALPTTQNYSSSCLCGVIQLRGRSMETTSSEAGVPHNWLLIHMNARPVYMIITIPCGKISLDHSRKAMPSNQLKSESQCSGPMETTPDQLNWADTGPKVLGWANRQGGRKVLALRHCDGTSPAVEMDWWEQYGR
ncbi:uncharacterized protein LACBIDRAFT_324628 [Laccaria bicolor S238N-H82]|uniref:Predicted protein n=1 Tax=Laccaria bicolor (strain S238N-H82 / ATCC MYA-4686) TaxID=486041 RepID=B0D2I9_LACBS|nr:uncharacterized protein LACBIDRAFT_324628 [Laccaria bicolor S238N-H82]EDR10757.1 predicted protein [Laccaria bicolor S238N-H82]|eukprot:XP_001878058.1 predicted protein [Laccaria bicolor S238N-H82]